jgi:hypothetical protein
MSEEDTVACLVYCGLCVVCIVCTVCTVCTVCIAVVLLRCAELSLLCCAEHEAVMKSTKHRLEVECARVSVSVFMYVCVTGNQSY